MPDPLRMWTIGHGTRAPDEFFALLDGAGVRTVVDVRRFPASRRHPLLSGPQLAQEAARRGVEYRWMEALGGRRRDPVRSETAAWRVAGFAAYASYMMTPAFQAAFADLRELLGRTTAAVMCAETLWTRCHRRLIADAVVAAGGTVEHILGPRRREPHRLPDFAVVVAGWPRYPAPLGVPGDAGGAASAAPDRHVPPSRSSPIRSAQ